MLGTANPLPQTTLTRDSAAYKIDVHHAFERALAITAGEATIITGLLGEVLAEYTDPHPAYAGNRRPLSPVS